MDEEYPGWLKENGFEFKKVDIKNKPAIRIGNIFEDAILNYVSSGLVHSREKFFELGVNSCHIDGIYISGLLEAKTTNLFTFWSDWGVEGTDQIPDYYYCQTQLQMGLSGYVKTIVPVLIFPERQTDDLCACFYATDIGEIEETVLSMDLLGLLKIYTVRFDEKVYKTIVEKSNNWWNKYIINKTPPTFELKNEKVILPLHGDIEAGEDICNAIKLYKEQENSKKEKEKKSKETKKAILNYMIENAKPGRSGFIRIRKEGRVLASFNSDTNMFSIKGEKDDD
jgi:hypothetical protein